MNVLILTPDRVGSTLLQRVLTVYMLRQEFNKPVINLHELTNGLEKYYNQTLNQEVLGKPRGTDWGYYQSLGEVEDLLKSVDHYKTSRLAHYHIEYRKDSIADQLKFYDYLNNNFFIISCRRENLLEHALSWCIQGHSKKLNVYSTEEKINVFVDIYKNGITIPKPIFYHHLMSYKKYIDWSETYFNIQSIWNYDTDVQNIEKYILNLDFMQSKNNTWNDMFGQDFNIWNACHRMLPNLSLLDRPNTTKQIKIFNNALGEKNWTALRGPDWPQTLTEFLQGNQTLPTIIEKEIDNLCKTEISITDDEFSFLEKNLNLYTQTNSQLLNLVKDGFLVTGVPLKLQSFKEKKMIIKNFDDCVNWYNQWVTENNFGNMYSNDELDKIMIDENQQLNLPIDQQILLK
jgi:hypothetical protein